MDGYVRFFRQSTPLDAMKNACHWREYLGYLGSINVLSFAWAAGEPPPRTGIEPPTEGGRNQAIAVRDAPSPRRGRTVGDGRLPPHGYFTAGGGNRQGLTRLYLNSFEALRRGQQIHGAEARESIAVDWKN